VPTDAASVPVEAASAASDAASSPASEASAPAAPKPKIVAPPAPPVEEPSFFSGLFDDPLLPLVGGGLLALLAGFGVYSVVKRRRNAGGVDSSFLESRIQPDSFFGASGGQRIDTANSEMTTGGSSMAYSPSQLDAGGDVDPVAEADVYLAYGRDLQAEEILKEAIRHNPARVSVHVKLGEIYAKRQDRKALEAVAGDVFKLTQGEGPDWARIVDLGRGLDPENPLYQPGGRPGGAADMPPAGGFASTMPGAVGVAGAALPSDLDLDLDLDLPDDALTEAPAAGGFAAAAAASGLAPELDLPSLDDSEPVTARAPMAGADNDRNAPSMADDLSMLPSALTPLSTPALEDNTLEFDLGDLSLDLSAPVQSAAPVLGEEITTASAPMDEDDDGEAAAHDDPLATKLALAEEFNAIGDTDGARTLIEEVVAEATGPLKTRAQRLLAELG
jgi:pilus assembly protein FimV